MGLVSDFLREMRHSVVSLRMRHNMQRQLAKLRAEIHQQRETKIRNTGIVSRDTLSIVVPCFGHSRCLTTMIKSVAAQSSPPDEIVFVNDNSPDATLEQLEIGITESGLRNLTQCTILNNKTNLGQAATLNIAIAAAHSDLIMVLNDDDYLFHDALQVTVEMFRLHHNIHMLGGLCVEFNDDRQLGLYNKELLKIWPLNEIPFRIFDPKETAEYTRLNDLNVTHSGCSFFKQSWKDVGGYRVNKNERIVPFSDRDFQLRFNARFPIGIMDIPISFWRCNSSVDAGINS